ncbi:MAG: hypothetical protein K8S27_07100 [Candidatus Omnitrophica bacterium]|nr:hypothetical protein [Candidatus Omnitrophota bacterium]
MISSPIGGIHSIKLLNAIPCASLEYIKSRSGYHFDQQLIYECPCLKPALGMVYHVFQAEKVSPDDVNFFFIGDRTPDVQTALNINGTGILVPFENEPREHQKVQSLPDQTNIHVVTDCFHAARYIHSKVSS